jgi:serine/threonine protein kinase
MLGAGGMGVVYEAVDRELHARVALKCLPSSSPEAFLRFKNEFRALRDLHHENLVRLGELVFESGQLFFTMELVEGCDLISYCWGERVVPRERSPASHDVNAPARPPKPPLSETLRASEDRTLDESDDPVERYHGRRTRARPGELDEARVRDAFAQLVRGLGALHAAGKVHRDVKPSNVLTTATGRVVLLDFGLVTDLTPQAPASEGRIVGTVDYMAPEQAARGAVGPAADHYAVGVMLFEVLTGSLPFCGRTSEVLRRKQHERPPAVRELHAGVSDALNELCAALLEPRPELRPSAEDMLAVLELDAGTASRSWNRPLSPFVGRQLEIDALQRALSEASLGRIRVVHVEGESGTGKTTLLGHFIEQASTQPDTLILTSRCSEREVVPYKTLDGVVDGLAEFIARSSSPNMLERAELALPELARAFPAFGRVRPAHVPWPAAESDSDPHVRRLLLFRALRELLVGACAERVVIVCLDDMQWADADSVALLSALLRGIDDARLLFVLAGRPAVHNRSLRRLWGGELLPIGNLPAADAAALAGHLLRSSGIDASSNPATLAERIALEAGGHPLFVAELVQQALHEGGRISAPAALDAALWSRIERLEPHARLLLEFAAIAGGALALGVLNEAALRASDEHSPSLAELLSLRNEHLLRFDGTAASSRVEPYHDRIAAAVRARLPPDRQRALHGMIAEALEAQVAQDPAELAHHWLAAGERVRAAKHALEAAELADRALAFERAARLYGLALENWPEQPQRPVIREKLGEALANAGLGAAAARAFLEASDDADDLSRVDLQRRAADQLFRSGHVDEAEPLIRGALHAMGVTIPRSPFWSFVALVLARFRLACKRLNARTRATPASLREVARLNACWSVAVGLSMVNNIRGACLQSRHLLLALRVGQPLPLLKALAAEAGYVAVSGQRARARVNALLERADALAAGLADPYATGFTTLSKAICSFLMGDWAEARVHAWKAESVFEKRPAGAMWELTSARTFGLWSSFYLGDTLAMRARTLEFIQEAETRGDRYAGTLHRTGLVALMWLASDEPERAREQVLEAEAGWSRPSFDFPRYLSTLAHSMIDVYEGAPELAWRRTTEMWPALKRSLYLRIQNLRFEALYMRGVAAIGVAAVASARERALNDAEECARRIGREGVGWAAPLAGLLSAGIADVRGEREVALAHWRGVERAARAHKMELFARSAAYRIGLAAEGDSGEASVHEIRSALGSQQIRDPDRLCALLAPGRPQAGLRVP